MIDRYLDIEIGETTYLGQMETTLNTFNLVRSNNLGTLLEKTVFTGFWDGMGPTSIPFKITA